MRVDVYDNDDVVGGYQGNWTIPWNQLQNANEIIFHVVSPADKKQDALYDFVFNLEANSKRAPLPEIR